MSKTLTELTTLNKHPFIQNLRKAAKEGKNNFTSSISLAATDTYGDKTVAKAKPSWGSFSGVFSGKDSVLKVYHDPVYHDFVKYAQAHQDDPHMPKIYSHTKTADGIGLVRMEKLHDIRDGNVYDPKNASNNRSNPHFSAGGVFDPYNEELWQARTGAGLHGLLHDVPGKLMREKQPSFHKSLSSMALHFHNKAMDFSPDNIMQRHDGTPVITDPMWDEHHWVNVRKGSAAKLLNLSEMMTLNRHPVAKDLSTLPDALSPQGWKRDPGYTVRMALFRHYGGTKGEMDIQDIPHNHLGTGMYGSAYSHKDHVIKVYRNDHSYEDFVNYAKANQDNPHMPRIYAHKVLNPENHTGVVKLEKLDPVPHEHYDALENIRAYGNYIYRDQRSLDSLGGETKRNVERFQTENPTLHQTLDHLAKYGMSKRSIYDLHSGNVMYRKSTGHVVLTDPIANAD